MDEYVKPHVVLDSSFILQYVSTRNFSAFSDFCGNLFGMNGVNLRLSMDVFLEARGVIHRDYRVKRHLGTGISILRRLARPLNFNYHERQTYHNLLGMARDVGDIVARNQRMRPLSNIDRHICANTFMESRDAPTFAATRDGVMTETIIEMQNKVQGLFRANGYYSNPIDIATDMRILRDKAREIREQSVLT